LQKAENIKYLTTGREFGEEFQTKTNEKKRITRRSKKVKSILAGKIDALNGLERFWGV